MSEAWVSCCLSDLIRPHHKLAYKQSSLFWLPFMRCPSNFRYPYSEAETEPLSSLLRLPYEGQDSASSQPSELPLVGGPSAPASMAASLLIPDRLAVIAAAINTVCLGQCFYHCHLRCRLETLTFGSAGPCHNLPSGFCSALKKDSTTSVRLLSTMRCLILYLTRVCYQVTW